MTGLRFFTVYGPWGRPDMALFLFTRNILAGKPIDVFNHGHHRRDFTYVDDIAEGVVRACDRIATANPAWDGQSPDPATSRRTVPALQHRQQPPGRAAALHRGARAVPRPQGAEEHAAAAGGRRARHLGRHRRPAARRRLHARDTRSRWASAASSTGTWSTTARTRPWIPGSSTSADRVSSRPPPRCVPRRLAVRAPAPVA